MADCGSLFGQIAAQQQRIDNDNAQLMDQHLCDNLTKQECINLVEQIMTDRDDATAQRDALQQQVTPICNLLIGTWHIDANGSDGLLTIEQVDSITGQSLAGHMALTDQPGSPQDIVKDGSWVDVAKVIVFIRANPDPNVTVTQTYTGFLGDNHADQFVILAGSFTESDIPPGTPRSQFGWFARKP